MAMYTRIAEARDLHRLTEITTSSLRDDPTFDYMWTRWREYPEDNFVWWQMKLQKWLYDPRTLILVTVLTEEDEDDDDEKSSSDPGVHFRGPREIIISFGIWERWSRSSVGHNRWHRRKLTRPKTWERRLNNKIDIACTALQQWSLDRSGPRRDANFKHVNAFFDALDAVTTDLWSDVDELWNLDLLVTHRSYRRRGAASRLLEWGLEQADEEGVHCRVEASPMGKLLYEVYDFKELETRTVTTEDDTETLPICCMRRLPPSGVDRDS